MRAKALELAEGLIKDLVISASTLSTTTTRPLAHLHAALIKKYSKDVRLPSSNHIVTAPLTSAGIGADYLARHCALVHDRAHACYGLSKALGGRFPR